MSCLASNTYYAGTAVRINLEVRNAAGELVDADNLPTWACLDPDGESHSSGDFVNVSTGVYYAVVQTSQVNETGNYKVTISAESGGYTSLVKPVMFHLIEGSGT